MAYQTYTAGQVYSDVWAQSQAIAQQGGLTQGQAYEFGNIAEATAIQESGLNPYAENINPPTESSYGVFQDNVLGGLGSPYASNPGALFNPNTSAQVSLQNMLNVFKSNPSASPGQIAAASQRPANPIAYANSVNSTYSSLTAGQMPVNLSQQFTGPSQAASATVPSAPTPNVRWYNPSTWGNAAGSLLARGAFVAVGGVLVLIGIRMLFEGGSKISVNMPSPATKVAGAAEDAGEAAAIA